MTDFESEFIQIGKQLEIAYKKNLENFAKGEKFAFDNLDILIEHHVNTMQLIGSKWKITERQCPTISELDRLAKEDPDAFLRVADEFFDGSIGGLTNTLEVSIAAKSLELIRFTVSELKKIRENGDTA